MPANCPRCGRELPDASPGLSCPSCGRQPGGGPLELDDEALTPVVSIVTAEGPRWRAVLLTLQHLARAAALLIFALALLTMVAALGVGVTEVFAGAPGSDAGMGLYILAPSPMVFASLSGGALLGWYVALVLAIFCSLALLAWRERAAMGQRLLVLLKQLRAPDRRSSEGLVQIPQLFLAVFFFDELFMLVVEASGNTPQAPDFGSFPRWYLYLTLAHASVYEELAARVLFIGLPLLVAYAFAHSSRPAGGLRTIDYLRSRTRRGLRSYVLGGGFDVGPLEALFLVASAVMFGLAHVPGWDLWKVLPTFVAGLAFGYLFLTVGLHAAIVLHFSFDYLSLGLDLLPGAGALWAPVLALWMVVGAFYFGHYIAKAFGWLRGLAGRG
ncbi:MAG: CPBP family glutamic-type intramembrane protease [Thermoplasmatota archaeon]